MKLFNIQKALYQFLSKNLSIPVEDRIDPDTPKPYVAMADIDLQRNHARKIEGLNINQELIIYSNFDGKDEVIKIADEIRELVRKFAIEIEDAEVHSKAIESISISQFDVSVYEGQMTLRLKLFEY
jgi:hypothetical protein